MSTVNRVARRIGSEDIILKVLEHMIWPILGAVILFTLLLVPQTFRNFQSIELILWGSVPLGFLGLAEGLCLISGHFDLSIGSVAGFSAMLTGMLLGTSPSAWGVISNPYVGFIIILSVGSIIGLANGVIISKLGVDPFLQTLSFYIIFRGGVTALNTQPVTGLPEVYTYPGGTRWVAIGLLIAAFIAFALIMRYTNYGQAIYGLGSDDEAARAVGVDTDLLVISIYGISGLLAGMAGLMITGYTNVVPPTAGENLVFLAFAGAVIGGVDLFGGNGQIFGAFGGLLLMAVVKAALNIAGVPPTQLYMINGIVLLIAILLYNTKTTIRGQLLSRGGSN